MPIGFLRRHAIELYLKSIILVVHRRFTIPWGDRPFGAEPQIVVNGKPRALFNTHSIRALHDYAAGLFRSRQHDLNACSRTDWESAFSPELNTAVEKIEAADVRGTFFRYPVSGDDQTDREKSSMKRYDLDKLTSLPQLAPGAAPVKAMIAYDSNDQVVATYAYDHDALAEVREALEFAAEHLSTVHFAVRAEISRGA